MTTKVTMGVMPWAAGTIEIPVARGPLYPHHGEVFGLQRLSTDAIGTFTLALKNAVRGSRYVIERSADDSLATPTGNAEGVIPAGAGTVTDVNVTLDYYSGGSANNDLRITVRNASSSPAYREFVTQIVAQAGTVIAYCLQQTDE